MITETTQYQEGIPIPESFEDAQKTMQAVMGGKYKTDEVVTFLEFYQETPPPIEAIRGFLQGIKDSATYTIDAAEVNRPLLDISGTGADGMHTANISSLSGLLVASNPDIPVAVAKYGNRAASGISGSMDTLEALGVDINLTRQKALGQLDLFGFAPIFARNVYPGAGNVAEARKIVGPSLFNTLFPLVRPLTGEHHFVLGVNPEVDMHQLVQFYEGQPDVSGIIVRGMDGLDEVSVSESGLTEYALIRHGSIQEGVFDCRCLGIEPSDVGLLQIDSPEAALTRFVRALDPQVDYDPKIRALRASMLANAALGIFVTRDTSEPVEDASRYVTDLQHTLESGEAFALLKRLSRSSAITLASSAAAITDYFARQRQTADRLLSIPDPFGR